jgi:nitrate reductase NapAB chaperone NapD
MHYSGILVTTDPRHFSDCLGDLKRLNGVEVFHQDPGKGRVVVVQETATIKSQEIGFNRMGSLPHVLSVELVYHYRDPDPSETATADSQSQPRKVTRL